MVAVRKGRSRKIIGRILLLIVLSFGLVSILILPVEAHRLIIAIEKMDVVMSLRPECPILNIDVKRIEILTLLGPTVRAGNISVKVYDPDGSLYVEGWSDYQGRFVFELPLPAKPGKWEITGKYPVPLHTAVLDFYIERSIISEQAPQEVWPVYMTVIAASGYAIGAAGMVLAYVAWRARRRSLLGLHGQR